MIRRARLPAGAGVGAHARADFSARTAALAACLAIGACANEPIGPDAPKVVRGEPLMPYDIREECLPLAAGDRIDYDFSTTQPVAFNIHYHDANAVVAPIVREGARADSGILVARIAQDYCLMWEAGPAGAVLDYRVQLRLAAR